MCVKHGVLNIKCLNSLGKEAGASSGQTGVIRWSWMAIKRQDDEPNTPFRSFRYV
ncbi:hypothetical protein HanPSC8_Chr04g0150681 [Helianthus annuus]|nr:hypothetical protein HanPSC8_Chr04g0150681 [Helianthus annuus]